MLSPVDKQYSVIRLYIDNQLNIDLYFVKTPNYPMEMFLTGNKYFNIYMKKRA